MREQTERIGRSIYHENRIERVERLSLFSKVVKAYYQFRIRLIERRVIKWGSYSMGYRYELFQAAVYEKQSYLHKVEALFMKDELRALKKEYKRSEQNG